MTKRAPTKEPLSFAFAKARRVAPCKPGPGAGQERARLRATLQYFEKQQAKRRAEFRERLAGRDADRAAFRRNEPGATGSSRKLDVRQRAQVVFEAKLAERGKAPAQQKKVSSIVRGARSGAELLASLRAMNVAKYTTGVYRSAHNNYVRACLLFDTGLGQTYSLEGLTVLVCIYVETWKRQSSSLSDLITRLKRFARAADRPWISAEEEEELTSVRRMLERQFPSMVIGAKALTWAELDPLLELLQAEALSGNIFSAQVMAMVLMAHDCMMRGNEYLGRSLLREDVKLVQAGPHSGLGGLIVICFMTKTRKLEFDERDDLRLAVARPREPRRCARLAMQTYLSLADLQEKDVLFPRRSEDGTVVESVEKGFSYDQFTAVLRKQLRRAKVPEAESFVARSMRAGGHTDFAAEGVDSSIIGMMGGWKDVKSQARYMRLAKAGLKALSYGK